MLGTASITDANPGILDNEGMAFHLGLIFSKNLLSYRALTALLALVAKCSSRRCSLAFTGILIFVHERS